MRYRSFLLGLLACLALALVGAPAAGAAANGSSTPVNIPPLKTVTVHGAAPSGKQFTGTYGIERFIARGSKVYSIGTLEGTLKGRHIVRYGVLMPATLNSGAGAARSAQASTCTLLHLVLGPINLSLLGLNVNLGGGNITPGQPAQLPITLNLTGTPGGGLLGDLLCGLDNVVGGTGGLGGLLGQLSSSVSGLAAALNSLVAALP